MPAQKGSIARRWIQPACLSSASTTSSSSALRPVAFLMVCVETSISGYLESDVTTFRTDLVTITIETLVYGAGRSIRLGLIWHARLPPRTAHELPAAYPGSVSSSLLPPHREWIAKRITHAGRRGPLTALGVPEFGRQVVQPACPHHLDQTADQLVGLLVDRVSRVQLAQLDRLVVVRGGGG